MHRFCILHLFSPRAINFALDIARNYFEASHYHSLVQALVTQVHDVKIFKQIRWNNTSLISDGQVFWPEVKAAELERIYGVIRTLSHHPLQLEFLAHLRVIISEQRNLIVREKRERFRQI